ncbi:hypothetical protein TNCV_3518412 [Trichonephila clavipes]|uniref:Uncharacterized protein n=1 Tax=Trichonephila clavipes TaxID=2585209 RepID=A0A8X6SQ04_TRICX|nr:hypothetical protein TNCV_3518412 [Trichonephila clavipes]
MRLIECEDYTFDKLKLLIDKGYVSVLITAINNAKIIIVRNRCLHLATGQTRDDIEGRIWQRERGEKLGTGEESDGEKTGVVKSRHGWTMDVYLQVDDHVHPGNCPPAVSSEKKQDLLHMEFYHHLPSWAMNEQMSYFSSFSDEWSRDLKTQRRKSQ